MILSPPSILIQYSFIQIYFILFLLSKLFLRLIHITQLNWYIREQIGYLLEIKLQ